MKNIRSVLMIILFLFVKLGYSQTTPFKVAIVPIEIEELGGLQSFAWRQHGGKWLIIGGRLLV